MSENENMKSESDPTLVWQWLRINVPTMVALGGMLWYMAANDARTIGRIDAIEQSRMDRSKEADIKFANINNSLTSLSQKVEPISNVTYRVGVVETQISETNKRLDRLSEQIINSLDLIRRDVNGLSTRIEVLSNKVDAITPARKAGLSMPSSPVELANQPLPGK